MSFKATIEGTVQKSPWELNRLSDEFFYRKGKWERFTCSGLLELATSSLVHCGYSHCGRVCIAPAALLTRPCSSNLLTSDTYVKSAGLLDPQLLL